MSKKKSRPVYLDNGVYEKAVQKAKGQLRSFSNYVEKLIKLDVRDSDSE